MSDPTFNLASSARAIAGMEDAVHLFEQKGRVEQSIVSGDTSLALDTSKAFLESVFKTILSDRVPGCDLEQDLTPLFKCLKVSLPFNRDAKAQNMLSNMTGAIVHSIAELRNRFGAASHGNDGYHQNPIEQADAELVARLADGVAGFVFNKHKANIDPSSAVRIYYDDYPDFNDFWDAQNEGYFFHLDDTRVLEILPSKLLFMADADALAYREMLLQFRSSEIEDQVGEDAGDQSITVPESIIPSEVVEATLVVQPVIPIPEGAQLIFETIAIHNVPINDGNSESLFIASSAIAEFAKLDAGVDWQNRDSLRAAFRNHIRRLLTKFIQPEELLLSVTDAVLEKAAEIYPSQMGASV
jgi:hypothetical protein